jgi:hypothetical protein
MMNCEKWEAYPKEIVSAHDVWGLTQQGDMKSFDDAFTWSRPKTFTKQEHIEKFLLHLNQRVSSLVAEDGYIYLAVQWKKGNYSYSPRFFRFRYSDLPKGESFFIIVKDKWNNNQLSITSSLDTWMVQENRRGTPSHGRYRQGNNPFTKSSQNVQNLMAKLLAGNTLTTQELQELQSFDSDTDGKTDVAFVRDMTGAKRPRWNVNLSKYYRQPKHRACLHIFVPSEAEIVRKIDLGIFNWFYCPM